jgi:hypothetical protein
MDMELEEYSPDMDFCPSKGVNISSILSAVNIAVALELVDSEL